MSGPGSFEQRWAEGLREGVLQLPRCAACGAWNWYPKARCSQCGGAAFQWTDVRRRGTIHSWTRIHRSFSSEPAAPLPYVVALVGPIDAPEAHIVSRQIGAGTPTTGDEVVLAPTGGGGFLCWGFVASSGA